MSSTLEKDLLYLDKKQKVTNRALFERDLAKHRARTGHKKSVNRAKFVPKLVTNVEVVCFNVGIKKEINNF